MTAIIPNINLTEYTEFTANRWNWKLLKVVPTAVTLISN